MEQCAAHEDDLFTKLDGETWQYLMSELRTTYISDTELDTFMSDCWLEHPTPEEPHYKKLTDICHYSDISSDDMETELEGKILTLPQYQVQCHKI